MATRTPLLAGAAIAGLFVSLLWLERRHPLRRRVQPQPSRVVRNLAIGATAAAVVALAEAPVAARLTRAVERHQLGLVPRLGLPRPAQQLLTLLLLDYTLYLWHILLHRLPFLWRWHQVHHRDLDLDVSTAARFHGMELAWSVPWRAAQILLIGVPPGTLSLWGRLTAAEVMFHHSNLRLPGPMERVLGKAVVTPAQHGIHHADAASLQHSNFSSGLVLWDLLHGTARRGVPQESITIGLPKKPVEG